MPVESVISNTATFAAGAISTTTFAAGAIDATAIAANAIGASELATDAVTEIVGTVTNTGGTATVGAVLGDPANVSIAQLLANLGARVLHKSVTFTGATSYAAFNTTSAVAVKVIGVVTGALTNHADTVSVGTDTSAAGLIAATAGTALQTVQQIWVDNAPSKFETFPANWTVITENIVVASTANIAGGVISLYCFWFPVQLGATVTAA